MKKPSEKKQLPTAVKYLLRTLLLIFITLVILAAGLYSAMYIIVNGPSETVGNLFVLSLKETSAGGFLADWYMSKEKIEALRAEKATEEAADINPSLIKLPQREENDITGNEKGDDPMGPTENVEKNSGIEVQDVKGGTYHGKMLIIKDPKRVFVGVPDSYGEDAKGLSLSKMIEKYGALGGTNAGGFIDPNGSGTGGIPEGIVIYEGELLWGEENSSYSIAALDGDGLLHVGKYTGKKALELGIKYAVSYGPALIINGEPCNAKRSLGGGVNPRTAIGQRADGAILLLVVNGRQIDSLGATLDDLVEIMLAFGAVNASNLDGGSSSLMKLDGEFLNTSSYILGAERVLASAILISPEK